MSAQTGMRTWAAAQVAVAVGAFAAILFGVRAVVASPRVARSEVFAIPIAAALVVYATRTPADGRRRDTIAAVAAAGWVPTIALLERAALPTTNAADVDVVMGIALPRGHLGLPSSRPSRPRRSRRSREP